MEEAQPASRSLASIAFDVVKSYVRIFPSWKYYTEDEGKCQLQVFVQELCVSNVIHGNYFASSHTSYLHDGYNTANFPIFLYREGPIWKLKYLCYLQECLVAVSELPEENVLHWQRNSSNSLTFS